MVTRPNSPRKRKPQRILGGLSDAAAQAAWIDIREQLRVFDTSGAWAGPNELLITAARRPGVRTP